MNEKADVKLAIVDLSEIDMRHVDAIIDRRLMHYKAAASYAAKVVKNPERYFVNRWGKLSFKNGFRIIDATHGDVAVFGVDGRVRYFAMIEGTEVYAAVKYVIAAINNAIAELNEQL